MTNPAGPYGTVYPLVAARWRRRAWVAAVLGAVLLVAVIVVGVLVSGSGSSLPRVGDCAADGDGDALRRVDCDSPQAFGRVIKVVPEQAFGMGDPGCPDRTDSFSRIRGEGRALVDIACIRNLRPPHPGDPGAGGGGLTGGDCLDGALFLSEVTCSAEASGHLAARVAAEADCPEGTLDVVTRNSGPLPVLCLDSGQDVLSPGDCIADPRSPLGLLGSPKVACESDSRFARVLARAPSAGACPPGTRLPVEDTNGVRDSRIICLQ